MLYFGGTWVGSFYLNSSINQLYWEFKKWHESSYRPNYWLKFIFARNAFLFYVSNYILWFPKRWTLNSQLVVLQSRAPLDRFGPLSVIRSGMRGVGQQWHRTTINWLTDGLRLGIYSKSTGMLCWLSSVPHVLTSSSVCSGLLKHKGN